MPCLYPKYKKAALVNRTEAAFFDCNNDNSILRLNFIQGN